MINHRKGSKVARVAVVRSLLCIVYRVLKDSFKVCRRNLRNGFYCDKINLVESPSISHSGPVQGVLTVRLKGFASKYTMCEEFKYSTNRRLSKI